MKQFDKWNEVKKQVDTRKTIINFKEREIYWGSLGENIGFEQNGKGDDFLSLKEKLRSLLDL